MITPGYNKTSSLPKEKAGNEYMSNEKFSKLLNAIPSIVSYVDKDHLLQYSNAGFNRMFHKDPSEFIGKHVVELIGETAYEAVKPYMETALSGTPVHYRMEVPFKDGRRFVEATYTPDIDEHGNVLGYTSMVNDITQKMQIEEALEDSRRGYQALLENIPVALYTCDASGLITLFNKAATELWGRQPQAGESWCGSLKIFNPDGSPLDPDTCPMAVTLKEGRPVTGMEILIERPDGERRHVLPYPVPIFDKSGKLKGAINMLLDITDRKIAEKDRAHLAAIVHSSSDPIISRNLNGIITSWNEAAERIFGYTEDEMIGQPLTRLIPDDRKNEETLILDRLKQGERVEHFETKRITKDRQLLDISLTISPVKDAEGKVIGASKIARDISSQKHAEQLILESEERLRMAVQSTHLGTWEYFPLRGILSWSEECRKIYEAPADLEVTYDFFTQHIHPEDAAFAQGEISKAMSPGGSGHYDIQYRILRYSDKQPRWIRAQGKVYFNPNREAERFIGTVLDITEEKIREQELKNNVELFTTMADNVPAMIWMSGDDKFCDFFNRTWLEFTGRTIEQESNEGWLENVHPDDVEKCIEDYKRSLKDEKGFYSEYRLKRHDGNYRWIADNSVPRYHPDGSFAGFISACIDIEDQKNSRERIMASELRFKTISNAAPVGLWMTDTEGRNTFVNDTWIEWTGMPFVEQLGTGWLKRVVPEDKVNAPFNFEATVPKRERYSTEFRITRPDGELRWCLTEGSPYYNIDGSFAGYAGSVTDITDLKKMEERKDSFIKMASHELKTPITSINGYVQLLLKMNEEPEEGKLVASRQMLQSSLGIIAKQVSKLTRLISELLDLSRIESGKLELQRTAFSLTQLVEETVQEVQYTSARHNIVLHNEFEGEIYADKDRISQVLLNLLTNAIKYSPAAGTIEVVVKNGGNNVHIQVKDNGIGIDKKDHEKIFQRFYRVEGKSEQTYPGFGIGLFIASEIVQRHNGSIFVENNTGGGSVFTVILPIGNPG